MSNVRRLDDARRERSSYTAKAFRAETECGEFVASGTLCGHVDVVIPQWGKTLCLSPDEVAALVCALDGARRDVLDNSRPFDDARLREKREETRAMGDLSWHNKNELPGDVRAVMRDVLSAGLRLAASKEDPGDGYMTILGIDREIGAGMHDGGWKLQASHVHDTRLRPKPYVVVYAYGGSQIAKGSVSADVVRSPADERAIAVARLCELVKRRESIDAAIAKLRAELGEVGAS